MLRFPYDLNSTFSRHQPSFGSLTTNKPAELQVLKFCHLSHSKSSSADCRVGRDAVIDTVKMANWQQPVDPEKDVVLS